MKLKQTKKVKEKNYNKHATLTGSSLVSFRTKKTIILWKETKAANGETIFMTIIKYMKMKFFNVKYFHQTEG